MQSIRRTYYSTTRLRIVFIFLLSTIGFRILNVTHINAFRLQRPAFTVRQEAVAAPRRNHAFPLKSLPLDDNDDYDDDYDDPPVLVNGDVALTKSEAESLTIPQLKQQLRLRGLKVSGRKGELVDRLLQYSRSNAIIGTRNSFGSIRK